MRVFLAFLLGIAVTVGGAFLRDSVAAPADRPFVNWEVVKESVDRTLGQVREQWNRLTSR